MTLPLLLLLLLLLLFAAARRRPRRRWPRALSPPACLSARVCVMGGVSPSIEEANTVVMSCARRHAMHAPATTEPGRPNTRARGGRTSGSHPPTRPWSVSHGPVWAQMLGRAALGTQARVSSTPHHPARPSSERRPFAEIESVLTERADLPLLCRGVCVHPGVVVCIEDERLREQRKNGAAARLIERESVSICAFNRNRLTTDDRSTHTTARHTPRHDGVGQSPSDYYNTVNRFIQ